MTVEREIVEPQFEELSPCPCDLSSDCDRDCCCDEVAQIHIRAKKLAMYQIYLNCCVFRHVHLKIRIRLVVLWALKEVRVNAVVLFIYSITIIEKSLQRFVIYLCRERTGAFRLLLRGRRPTRCRPLAFPVRRDGKLRCFGHVPPRHSGNAIALRVRRNQRRLRRRLFSVRSFFAKKTKIYENNLRFFVPRYPSEGERPPTEVGATETGYKDQSLVKTSLLVSFDTLKRVYSFCLLLLL